MSKNLAFLVTFSKSFHTALPIGLLPTFSVLEGDDDFLNKRELPSVLIAFDISDNLLSELRNDLGHAFEFEKSKSKSEALELAGSVDILVMMTPSEEIVKAATKCRWIHAMTAGVEDYLTMEFLKNSPSLVLTNSVGIHGVQISEHVFALVLAFTRNIRTLVLN